MKREQLIGVLAGVIGILFMLFVVTKARAGEGNISNVDDSGNLGHILVLVSGHGKMWVGCTIYPQGRGYYEVDLKPEKLSGGGEVSFYVMPSMNFASGKLDYTVALWEDKISLRKCEKKYGEGSNQCQWARKNGFQMEGRLDSRQGTYTPVD